MVHVPAKFWENISMRFRVTVRNLNITDGQTDGQGALLYLTCIPPSLPSKVNFVHPKWPINLKWPEMRSKVIFRHPKWPPKKKTVSIWNGQNCDRKWISEIQNGRSIWNGQKCDRKWISDIQNGLRQPFCQKFPKKLKLHIDLKWPLPRNAIESEFLTSKMPFCQKFHKN